MLVSISNFMVAIILGNMTNYEKIRIDKVNKNNAVNLEINTYMYVNKT